MKRTINNEAKRIEDEKNSEKINGKSEVDEIYIIFREGV